MLQHRRRKKQTPALSSSQQQWQQSPAQQLQQQQQQQLMVAAAQVSQQQQQQRQSASGVAATPTAAAAPHHGSIRNVELLRGRSGFGFTVHGQRPCLLGRIVPGSAADVAGLHEGDQLLAVNGTAAAQLSHERVVRLIASGGDAIKLLVADGARRRSGSVGVGALVDSSDDSEDPAVAAGCDDRETQYGRPLRTPRRRQRPQQHAKSGSAGRARSVSPAVAALQQQQQPTQLRQRYTAAGEHQQRAPPTALAVGDQAGYLFSRGAAAASTSGFREQQHDVRAAVAGCDRSGRNRVALLPRSTSVPDVSSEAGGGVMPAGRRRRPEESAVTAAAGATALVPPPPHGFLRAVVGYIGTIEVPQTLAGRGGSSLGSAGSALASQLQAVRSAVRRLRVEQRVHTLVSLSVRPDGVHLHGPAGGVVAHYPRQALTMCGTYCDDERFFSLVTAPDCRATTPDDRERHRHLVRTADGGRKIGGGGGGSLELEEEVVMEEEESGSSCHVFMVDPALSPHGAHAKVALQFGGLSCDPSGAVGCAEFPRSCSAILAAMSSLFRVGSGGNCATTNSGSTSRQSPASDGPVGRAQSARPFVASSGDTDSDSGLGRHSRRTAKGVSPSRAYVVSVDIPAGDGSAIGPTAAADPATQPSSPAFYVKVTAGRPNKVTAGRPNARSGATADAATAAAGALSAVPVGDCGDAAWPKAVTPAVVGNELPQQQRATPAPVATQRASSDASSGGSDRSGVGGGGGGPRMPYRAARPLSRLAAGATGAGTLASSSSVSSVSVSPAVFNIRAKADDSPLSQRSSADSLRRNMQRLMEARRTTLVRDTHSLSDTESLASVRSSGAGSSSLAPATTVSSPGNSDSSRAASASTAGRCEASRQLPAKSPALAGSASWRQAPAGGATAVAAALRSRHLSSSCETLSGAAFSASQWESASVCGRSAAGDVGAASAAGENSAMSASVQHHHRQLQQQQQQRRQQCQGEADAEGRQHSKLSPRAYPELAAATRRRVPSVVQLSECSAFDKVTAHDACCLAASTAVGPAASTASAHLAEMPKPVPAPRAAGVPLLAGKRHVAAATSAEAAIAGAALSTVPAQQVDARCQSVPPMNGAAAVAAAAALSGSRAASQLGRQAMSVAGGGHPKLHSALARLSKRWAQVGGSLRRPRQRRTELAYAESLIDPHNGKSGIGISCGSSTGVGDARSSSSLASENIGRVTRWALGLDKLLQDDSGIAVFTDFLRKEHSEENIVFWLACEKFRRAPQQSKVELAREIFHTHLSPRGTQAVNVDSTAAQQYSEERLAVPTDDMFDEAQKQVFQLMKMDCYARFLKSELYKNCIMAEMEEHRLTDKGVRTSTMNAKITRDDVSEEGSDVSETRRRRSLMLFLKESAKSLTRNADPLSRSRSSDADVLLKKQATKQPTDQQAAQGWGRPLLPGQRRPAAASAGLDSRSVREEADVMIVQSSGEDDVPAGARDRGSSSRQSTASGVTPRAWQPPQMQQPRRSRRFVMPDGAAVDVGASAETDTMRSIVERLCSERGIALTSVEVLAVGSDKPLDLSKKLWEMDPGADFIMEHRAVFKLDLPRRRTIAVRAKPQRLVAAVLRRVLHKYGYSIDDVILYLDGNSILSPDAIVSTVDGRRISVQESSDSTESGGRVKARRLLSKTSYSGTNNVRLDGSERSDDSSSDRYNSGSEASSSVEDIVDFEKTPFEERIRGVGSSGGSLLSRLRPSSSTEERSQRIKGKNKVRFAASSKPILPATTNGSTLSKNDDDGLLDLITRAQCSQYDDQRGATVLVGEVPAFLLQPSDDHRGRGVHSRGAVSAAAGEESKNAIDVADIGASSETPDWRRGPASARLPHRMQPVPRARAHGEPAAPSTHDISFSADGRVPTHEEAEALFGGTARMSGLSVTPAHDRGSARRRTVSDGSSDGDDDDCTPTRQSQGTSYRAELSQLSQVGADSKAESARQSDFRPAAADRSWYRPQWDDRDGATMDDDDECETEASGAGDGELDDDSGAGALPAAADFDPDRTLTAGDGDGSVPSGDLSVTGLASYLPPPSPFENASENGSRETFAALPPAPSSTAPLALGRPSLPPPYGIAVARVMTLAAAAGASPTSAAARGVAAAVPPAPASSAVPSTSAARSTRSSTLPGCRLSYASGPLIVDDDSGDDSALLNGGSSSTAAENAIAVQRGEAADLAWTVPLVPATGSNDSTVSIGGNIRKPQVGSISSRPQRQPAPAGDGTAAHLPQQQQQRYGFYHSVFGGTQKQPSLSRGGQQQAALGVTIPNSGSKITFV